MELVQLIHPEVPAIPRRVQLNGSEVGIRLGAGKALKIRTTGEGGSVILDRKVPDGKEWEVGIIVNIKEIDVA